MDAGFDLAIIGAGLNGLITAKTYLQVHPSASVVLYDNASSIGGVWSRERIYPGLKTNNLWGGYEFSDFPMKGYGLVPGQHIPGSVLHRYFTDYAHHFDLTRRIRLQTSVRNVEYLGRAGWRLELQDRNGDIKKVHAARLVVASGLTSTPSLPKIAGAEKFSKPLLHPKDWHSRREETSSARTVTVIGGGKSAMDVANECAARGQKVHWIIRKSGTGPQWFSPIIVTPFRLRYDKLNSTRFLNLFSPCVWSVGYQTFRRFLQQTWLGRQITNFYFDSARQDMIESAGWDAHPETAKLKPWSHVFWHGANVSIFNYDNDVLELVRNGRIQVHIEDIDRLEADAVRLANGTVLRTDILFCATGWKIKPAFTFSGISAEDLGLPTESSLRPDLIKQADAEVLQRFPLLQNAPSSPTSSSTSTSNKSASEPLSEPYRHFRFMIPPSTIPDRTIAFAGHMHSVAAPMIAQAQALWITAFFDDKLAVTRLDGDEAQRKTTLEGLRYNTYLHTQFCKHRAPIANGARLPDINNDSLPYMERLLTDLGVRVWRKSNWFWELFEPYGMADYRGLVEEWMDLVEQREGGRDRVTSTTKTTIGAMRVTLEGLRGIGEKKDVAVVTSYEVVDSD